MDNLIVPNIDSIMFIEVFDMQRTSMYKNNITSLQYGISYFISHVLIKDNLWKRLTFFLEICSCNRILLVWNKACKKEKP